jgi:hypothetical protein
MLNAAIGASVTLKPGNASAFLATQVVLATIQLAFGAIAVAEIPTASHSIHIMARKSYFFLGFMPAARTTRARSAQFRLRRELPCTRVVQILPAAQTTRTRH